MVEPMLIASSIEETDCAFGQEAHHHMFQANMPLSQCMLQKALLSVTVLLGKTVTKTYVR